MTQLEKLEILALSDKYPFIEGFRKNKIKVLEDKVIAGNGAEMNIDDFLEMAVELIILKKTWIKLSENDKEFIDQAFEEWQKTKQIH